VKILVADDDALSRRMMQGMLHRNGYEVVVAEDGLSACSQIANPDGPRLALVDWMMPGLDGLGVCRNIRTRNEDQPYVYIILLTSKGSNEETVEGLEAGADDYLTKPCHPGELKARLQVGRRILQLEDKLVEARDEMRIRATRDGLTSLWNRTMILSYLKDSLSKPDKAAPPVSVLLCDIDHFKSINDRYGHLVGDQVLKQVASRLQNSVRSNDYVGRYGGEEFLVVLNDCKADDLMKQADRVRASVMATPFATDAGDVHVSVSIGGTAVPASAAGISLELIVRYADEALYRAKDAGRNRVCLADCLVSVA
jgi:two-component system cell cycle response regulator